MVHYCFINCIFIAYPFLFAENRPWRVATEAENYPTNLTLA